MSWPYIHTLINHFPIILATVGAIAVLAAAMFQRRAVWVYALVSLTLAGITVYPAWASGDKASHAVRNAWYIQRGAVHAHSSAADITLWVVGITGLLALISLITLARTREAVSPARILRVLVGLGALLSIGSIGYTGYLGGQIVVDSPILASPMPPLPLPAPTITPTITPTVTPSLTPSTRPAAPTVVSPPPATPGQPAAPTTQPHTP